MLTEAIDFHRFWRNDPVIGGESTIRRRSFILQRNLHFDGAPNLFDMIEGIEIAHGAEYLLHALRKTLDVFGQIAAAGGPGENPSFPAAITGHGGHAQRDPGFQRRPDWVP